jgi:proteasome lid subunit RPN8/RPN11
MKIARSLYDEIVEHAIADAPNECCGIVSGDDGAAVKVYRARNKLNSPFSFEIHEQDLIRIFQDAEAAGHELRAIYHSHTRSAPEPSLTDIKFAALWPGILWIIVGLADGAPDVRTWVIRDGGVSDGQLIVE